MFQNKCMNLISITGVKLFYQTSLTNRPHDNLVPLCAPHWTWSNASKELPLDFLGPLTTKLTILLKSIRFMGLKQTSQDMDLRRNDTPCWSDDKYKGLKKKEREKVHDFLQHQIMKSSMEEDLGCSLTDRKTQKVRQVFVKTHVD